MAEVSSEKNTEKYVHKITMPLVGPLCVSASNWSASAPRLGASPEAKFPIGGARLMPKEQKLEMLSLPRRTLLGRCLAGFSTGMIAMGAIGPGSTVSGGWSSEGQSSAAPNQSLPAGNTRSGKPRFRTALVPSALGIHLNQWETIHHAVRLGFEAVEPVPQFLAEATQEELSALKSKMEELGLSWSAANLPVDFRGAEDRFQAGLKDLPHWARIFQQAGVDRLGTYIRPTHSQLTYLENFRLHVRRFRAIAEVLHDFGLRLGVEYVGPKTSWSAGRFPFIHTLRELRELLAEIDHPALGYTLDSWHWYTAEESREEILALPGKDVLIVHLNDAPASIPVDKQVDSVRELPLATGVIDIKAFLTALVEIGFDGPAYVEPFQPRLRQMPVEQALALVADSVKKCLALVD